MVNDAVLVAGGAVQAGGGIYLERDADRQLLELCRRGAFAFILTSRQMGKSSLVLRTVERLLDEAVLPVFIDLTEFGSQTTAGEWYRAFVRSLCSQVDLAQGLAAWDADTTTTPVNRFTWFMREVVLARIPGKVIVFVDEIDTTLRLDFTDDFFAAIRFLYQARATDPNLARLSFVMSGVATPADLIKDPARTPFNIGTRVELNDFSREEIEPVLEVFPASADMRAAVGDAIVANTGGHPYLTLRVAKSLADHPLENWSRADVEQRIDDLFFRADAPPDANLAFVRDMLTEKSSWPEETLRLYYDIRRGKRVADRDLDPVRSWLKLSGVVLWRSGAAMVRNPIYARAFDVDWTRRRLKVYANWRRRLARVVAVLAAVLFAASIPTAIFAIVQRSKAMRDAESAMNEASNARRQTEIADGLRRQAELADATAEKAVEQTKAALAAQQSLAQENAQLAARNTTALVRTYFAQAQGLVDQGRFGAGVAYLLRAAQAKPTDYAARDFAFDLLLKSGFAFPVTDVHVPITFDPLFGSSGSRDDLSPDGSLAVFCGTDKCDVVSSDTGRILRTIKQSVFVETAHFAGNNRTLVTLYTDDRGRSPLFVTTWNVETGERGRTVGTDITLPANRTLNRAIKAALSADGSMIVVSAAGSPVTVVNVQTGDVRKLLSTAALPDAIAIAPDGKHVAIASGDTPSNSATTRSRVTRLSIVDVATNVPVDAAWDQQTAIGYLTYSGSGRRLLVTDRGGIARVLTDGSNDALTLDGVTGPLVIAAFSDDGDRIVAGGTDGNINIWSAISGRSFTAPIHVGDTLTAVSFRDNGAVTTLTNERHIQTWRVSAAPIAFTRNTFRVPVAFGSSTQLPQALLVPTSTRALALLNMITGRTIAGPFDGGGSIDWAEMSQDGRRIIATGDNITIWNLGTGSRNPQCTWPGGGERFGRLSADGDLAVTWAQSVAKVWDVGRCASLRTINYPNGGSINFASITIDRRHVLLSGDNDKIVIVDLGSDTSVTVPHVAEVPVIDFSIARSRFVAVTDDTHVQIYDMTGAAVGTPIRTRAKASFATLDPTGTRVLTAVGDQVTMWQLNNAEPIGQVLRHRAKVELAVFSHDGQRVASVDSTGNARVWDALSGLPVTSWLPSGSSTDALIFGPDDSRLFVLGNDHVVIHDVFRSAVSDLPILETLTRAFVGVDIDTDGHVEDVSRGHVPVDAALTPSPGAAPLVRWLLADPATRSISPRSTIKSQDYFASAPPDDALLDRWTTSLGVTPPKSR